MRFTKGPLLDPVAQQARDEAIEKSEESRAEREAKHNKPRGANVPDGWKPYRRPTESEIDTEVLTKTRKKGM